MRKIIFIVMLSIALSSCGISYSVPRATLHIDLVKAGQMAESQNTISSFLILKGFVNLGKDEEMLALLERSSKRHEDGEYADTFAKINNRQINRINRTRRFNHEALQVDVEIVDYSDTSIKKRFANYPTAETKITDSPTLELNVYNYRPGGFSPEAHKLYSELFLFIKASSPGSIYAIFLPPKTNQAEFYKVRVINFVGAVLWWLFVYLIGISVFGFVVIKLLNGTKLSVIPKRTIFTLLGAALATPLPFPAATLFVIILPSVFAMSATSTDYFVSVQGYAIPSFIVSAIFCVLISCFAIRKDSAENV